jgi:uncharacterized protein YjbJ (UPF0337 family)
MNWNQVEGLWTQLRGKMREQWGRLAHRDIDVIVGKRDQLVGLLQRRYGAAEKQGDVTL